MNQPISDLFRRFENLIRIGTIAELDHAARKIRVQSGELLTTWLPYPAEIGNNYKRWQPLRLGTQVVLACPSGDPSQALIISILYSNDIEPPSTDENLDVVEFVDGTKIEYNSQTNTLSIDCAGDVAVLSKGSVKVVAEQKAVVNTNADAEVKAGGNVKVEGAKIELNGGAGVVTTNHICHLTGAPHGDGSSSVIAGK